MIEKRTKLDRLELCAGGVVLARFALDLVEDGRVIDRKFHRTSFEPGTDPEAQIAAVNAHLVMMNKQTVGPECAKLIKQHAESFWSNLKNQER